MKLSQGCMETAPHSWVQQSHSRNREKRAHLSLGADSFHITRPQPDSGQKADSQPRRQELRLRPFLWRSRPGVLRRDEFTGCCQMCSLFRGNDIELPTFILPNIDPKNDR